MKTILFVIVLSALMIAGCGNNSSKNGMHDHDDGSTHSHENGEMHHQNDSIGQQEFTVDPDSGGYNNHDHIADSTHNHPH